jgi:hypothetical protein
VAVDKGVHGLQALILLLELDQVCAVLEHMSCAPGTVSAMFSDSGCGVQVHGRRTGPSVGCLIVPSFGGVSWAMIMSVRFKAISPSCGPTGQRR